MTSATSKKRILRGPLLHEPKTSGYRFCQRSKMNLNNWSTWGKTVKVPARRNTSLTMNSWGRIQSWVRSITRRIRNSTPMMRVCRMGTNLRVETSMVIEAVLLSNQRNSLNTWSLNRQDYIWKISKSLPWWTLSNSRQVHSWRWANQASMCPLKQPKMWLLEERSPLRFPRERMYSNSQTTGMKDHKRPESCQEINRHLSDGMY